MVARAVTSRGARTTNRSTGALFLLALVLAGCATSKADPLPAITATPVATVVPRASAALEPVVGRMLAVDSLLRQTDSLLQSAYAAQNEQLPDSAHANFVDAGARTGRADRIFFQLGTAGRYQGIADNFGHAIAAYSTAAAEGTGDGARSQHGEAMAQKFLARAENALNLAPEASLPAALSAESAALASVTPPPPTPTPVIHHVTHHHATHPSSPASRGHSSTTLKIVIPTATPTVTPTVQATSTPAPTATPRPQPTKAHNLPAPRKIDPRILAAVRTLSTERADLLRALAMTTACRDKVVKVDGGTDAAGSASLLSCLRSSLRDLTKLHAARLERLHVPQTDRPRISTAAGSIGLAASELQRAYTDIRAIDLTSARTELSAAAAALHVAGDGLLRVETALKRAG